MFDRLWLACGSAAHVVQHEPLSPVMPQGRQRAATMPGPSSDMASTVADACATADARRASVDNPCSPAAVSATATGAGAGAASALLESSRLPSANAEERQIEIVVLSAIDGEHICTVWHSSSAPVSSLRRAVAETSRQVHPFDLLLPVGACILRDDLALDEAGLVDGVSVHLMRRSLRAADLSGLGYTEHGLGCLKIVYLLSGAELLLRGARAGSDKYHSSMCCEVFREPPIWAEDRGGAVLAHYCKTVMSYSAAESRTTYVRARRAVRLRMDLATLRASGGGMWVRLLPRKTSASSEGRDLFSGMRVEVLDDSEPDLLRVRCAAAGARAEEEAEDGWVRRLDVAGLGDCALAWDGPEEILEENTVDQTYQPVTADFAMRPPVG
eukprot:TRINITY_DN27556_c0_g4_i1.p1 TRINITY_DN27556_c0_g4~~TRINITY_DN27556_c0_g4_i1.p1  ORF type:complete len:384 (-),score=64.73 TRINITY_DN27556_c0_g4_i1:155-1306(-)